jgi:hypothetical protein
LREGPLAIVELVARIYAGYPTDLHGAAGESVGSHLRKLADEGRARAAPDPAGAAVRWELA